MKTQITPLRVGFETKRPFLHFSSIFVLIIFIFSLHIKQAYAQTELWGMTSAGGSDNIRTIFNYIPSTGEQNVQYNFQKINPGSYGLFGLSIGENGKFYGTTIMGGSQGEGVIFEWDPVTNIYIKKFDFNWETGYYPTGSLTPYNGKFYGMTMYGGTTAYDPGVIFEWDPVTNIYVKKYEFDGINGAVPAGGGSLILYEGKFYGMTNYGGTSAAGVIFEWDPVTNIYTKKFDFDYSNGAEPTGSLTIKEGKFYGMTSYGGTTGAGVIFEWDPAINNFSKKFDFADWANGAAPLLSSLTLNEGKFYGMTAFGGTSEAGVIFEWDPATNIYTKRYDFVGGDGIYGPYTFGNLIMNDGKFFGILTGGGANLQGELFEWDPATNIYTKKFDFNETNGFGAYSFLTLSGGKLYGMTPQGGITNSGVIYEWDISSETYTKKMDFNYTNGNNPKASLTFYNGKFYGMAENNTEQSSVIFEFDPVTKVYTKKIEFEGVNSWEPYGSLTLNEGKFYGITGYGGIGYGVIFEWDPATNIYTEKYDFNFTDGAYPSGDLRFFNGKFYGMASGGGVSDAGVIFEWDPVTNAYTKKYDFDYINGGYPVNCSLQFNEGKFYGMTYGGGSQWVGVIFEWDPVTNIYTKKYDFDFTNGGSPQGSLIFNCGRFYGMTSSGGALGAGVIFEWNPGTNILTKKYDFDWTFIDYLGSLTFSGGKFYGITNVGSGAIFEWDPGTNIYTNKTDFTGLNGSSPMYTTLVEYNTTPVPVTIHAENAPNVMCVGSTSSVPYVASGSFICGNVFSVQLSDSVGSFANPVTIGSKSDNTSGIINVLIPSNTPGGTHYRIRVISSNPAFTSNDNGTDIVIIPVKKHPGFDISAYKPQMPTTIYGTASVCPGVWSYTYSVNPVQYANQYNWTVPAKARILSGQGTTEITVEFLDKFTSGEIYVSAGNCSATSPVRSNTVSNKLSKPAAVAGPIIVCNGTAGVEYSILPVDGADSYYWEVSGGAIIESGQGTTAITVTFPLSFSTLNIRVKSVNYCGESPYKTLAVNTCSSARMTIKNEETFNESGSVKFKAFPNPTSGLLEIEFETLPELITNGSLRLIDINGKIYINEILDDNTIHNLKMNISDLPAQLYILEVIINKQIKTVKVLKE